MGLRHGSGAALPARAVRRAEGVLCDKVGMVLSAGLGTDQT
jgi:hypothetical protein